MIRPSCLDDPATHVDVESMEFLRQMAGLVPGIIYVFNHQTMSNEYTNRSIAELLGYSSDEILAMGDALFRTIIHAEDLKNLAFHLEAIKQLKPQEQAIWEYRAVRSDGQEVWLRSIDTVFSRTSDGDVLRHVGLAFDITAEKTSAVRLQTLNEELEQRVLERTRELETLNNELEARVAARTHELRHANKELEQLSYVATHDLKVPINNMSSLTRMLGEAEDILPPEHAETLGWMREVCDQASQKLEALVCVAQANAMLDTPFQAVDLQKVTEHALISLHYQIQDAKAVIKTDFTEAHVCFLPQEVESMLHATVFNALQYADPSRRPRIVISSERIGEYVALRVADNGCGLDLPKDEKKVFGLFQRAHTTPDGAGVALYTIRRILKRIGGQIDVDSTPGVGSTFNMYFPRPAEKN
ncbi:MAG: ATP-binding protein [Roseobacter sp.]